MGPLSGATTLGQSGPGSDGKKGVLRIPQSSSITGTSPSDCLASYLGHSLLRGGSYPSVEMQSVYSTAPADWAIMVTVNCWYCWEILRFVSDSFFFLPHLLVIFLFVHWSCIGIKNGRKKMRILLDSNLIFEVYDTTHT